MELEEELRVVGNNLKSLEVSEEKVRRHRPLSVLMGSRPVRVSLFDVSVFYRSLAAISMLPKYAQCHIDASTNDRMDVLAYLRVTMPYRFITAVL